MDATAKEPQDRIVYSGEKPVKLDDLAEKPLLPSDGRTVSENSALNAAIMGRPDYSDVGGDVSIVHPLQVFTPHDQSFSYGGYDGSSADIWDGYPHYVNADAFHVLSPVNYNDNSPVMFHSGYGFNSDMTYAQYSPVATPMATIMVDGQLYPSQQMPFSQSYYPQQVPPNVPHISSGFSPAELMMPENSNSESMPFGPGSGYMLQFGSYGGENLPGNSGSSSLPPPSVYSQPMGMHGSYEHNIGQGLVSNNSTGHYPYNVSYQNSHLSNTSISYAGVNDRNRFFDKGRRHDRDQEFIYTSNYRHDISVERNRGPRATKLKGKSISEQGSLSSVNGHDASVSKTHLLDLYNRLDFVTDYQNAKFFVIKSFSEDNVHKSIKYNVWASTPHGNKKLEAAYLEAQEKSGSCPLFLLFSVNGSGQFCGLAQMVGPVDFEKDADYWQQDRWSGQFPVQWHIIKDIPNSKFRHILLENNDNKPVTHSRDCQEVKLDYGVEMLKEFKDHDAHTSILDDFKFYDDRERTLKDRKARQLHTSTTKDAPNYLSKESVNQISDSFARAVQVEDSKTQKTETDLEDNGRE